MNPRLHADLRAVLQDAGWTGLTEAQDAALDPLLAGRHVLLVAPTGHGKTEAALLPVLSRVLAERDRLHEAGRPWPTGFKALYITPLRALNRDLLGRLQAWADALGLTVGVRHGDTTQAERARQARRPPDLLITTPETVQLLLYGDTLRRHLRTVRFIVLDEVHELAASERGAQLMVALERVEEVIAQDKALVTAKAPARPCPEAPSARPEGGFQRIGLSATIADPGAVARFMAGRRDVAQVHVRSEKRRELHVAAPTPDEDDARLGAAMALPPEAVAELHAVRQAVADHERVLVFSNTRDGAELLVSRSHLLDEEEGREPALELHHGSLSQEHRADVERRFKQGDLRAVVATSSLELGIDVGAIDHVVQLHSPRSVARLVQRLGRAGHRVGAVSRGTLLAGGAEDALECIVIARMAEEGRLEPLQMRDLPMVVLANQLIALVNEYADLQAGWCRQVIARAGPFLELDEDLFDVVWRTLAEVRTLYPSEQRPGAFARSGRARRHFLDHIGLIPDERTYRVVDEASKRAIGSVDDAFVAAGMQPGQHVVMAGRTWRVLEVEAEAARVRVAPVRDLGAVPQWAGQQLPVSRQVATAVAALRGAIARGEAPGPRIDPEAWRRGAEPVLAQVRAGLEVPTDTTVTLESARRRVTCNVPLGTRGNEALGRITQALLHQRLGSAAGMDHDAYRIHFTGATPDMVRETWDGLDPDTLDLLLGAVLQGSPVVRHHLVHVAKHFGALPKDLDPNKTTRKRLDALMEHLALEEETLSRLAHDRFDLPAVADFLRDVQAGKTRVVVQGEGPVSRLGDEGARRLLAPHDDTALLAAVRRRIEESDVLLACTNCAHTWQSLVADLPRRFHCRRCQSVQVACLRPWHADQVTVLRKGALDAEQQKQRKRIHRNAGTVAGFGSVACRCLVARGVGPDTTARILQASADPDDPAFWRAILHAELEFARTNAFW